MVERELRQARRSGEQVPEVFKPVDYNREWAIEYLNAYIALDTERPSFDRRIPYSKIAFYATYNDFTEEMAENLFYLIDALDKEHMRRVKALGSKNRRHGKDNAKPTGKKPRPVRR